ncbi:uncharacterized protein LOC142586874 isoform X2 [Dermacentor variabilis]|uniref:uncharacterized protein LOC142586874 isoform X2 n=1 Tax=Dermacentor variabilis TaxID=34621 RepID=UPI003F5BA166
MAMVKVPITTQNTMKTRRRHRQAVAVSLVVIFRMTLLCGAWYSDTNDIYRQYGDWQWQDASSPEFLQLANEVELDANDGRKNYSVASEVLRAYVQVLNGLTYNLTYVARKTRCPTTERFDEDVCMPGIQHEKGRYCNALVWQDYYASIRETYFYKCDNFWSTTYE